MTPTMADELWIAIHVRRNHAHVSRFVTACGIPATAAAYSLNVTAVSQNLLGFLSIWPADSPLPNVSTLNVYNSGTVVANAAIVPAGES